MRGRLSLAVLWLVACQVALALDGKILTNSDDAFNPGTEVAIVDCATASKTALATGGGYYGMCFSRDGKEIAYWRNGKIYVIHERSWWEC